jgi:hypothetical protein
MIRATARANWARRWGTNRSVFRRSWPKLESHELVRSTGQRMPSGTRLGLSAVPVLRRSAMTKSSTPRAVHSDRTMLLSQPRSRCRVSTSWRRPRPATASRVAGKQYAVVAVGPVGDPADRHAVAIGGDRPLPASLPAIGGVRPGAFARPRVPCATSRRPTPRRGPGRSPCRRQRWPLRPGARRRPPPPTRPVDDEAWSRRPCPGVQPRPRCTR